jgi:type II secretion system protein N
MIELKPRARIAASAAFFLAVFLLALRQTLPVDALRDRLVAEAAAQGFLLKVVDAGPAGLVGVRLSGLTVESRDGVRVPVDELRATLRLLPLLLGRRGVDYEVQLFDGRVRGLAEEARGTRRLTAAATGIDLARAGLLRRATGLDLSGKLEGKLELAIDDRDLARSTGKVDLKVEKAAVLGGQLQLGAFGGAALTIPKADMGTLLAQGQVREGKAVLDKLEARSADVEVIGEGLSIGLQPRLAYSPVFGRVRLKLADSFWVKSGTPALRGMAEAALAPARSRDGAYWFQLYGTVSQPLARAGQ